MQKSGGRQHLWACLAVFAVLALALRLLLAWKMGNIDRYGSIQRADEIFQALEPAHRLWSGWGLVSWEWRDGIRSWMFPGFLSGLMALFGEPGGNPASYMLPIVSTLAFVSLGVVGIGVVLGWQRYRLAGAVLCGLLCAVWPTLVYCAPKTLTEIQGGNFLAMAAGLACLLPGRGEGPASRRAALCATIGLLLGLAVALRFQLAPGAALVALWSGRRDIFRGWLPLVLAAALPLAALGATDYLTWGWPFQSIWKNFYVNVYHDRSSYYGTQRVYWYFEKITEIEGAALLPLAIGFWMGARSAPLLAWTAALTVLSHTLIAHKETSFIYAAAPMALIVVGLGSARLALMLPTILRRSVSPRCALALGAGVWLAVAIPHGAAQFISASREVSHGMQPIWVAIRQAPDLCGLGYFGLKFPWPLSGGYTYLNRPVPIYLVRTPERLAAARPAFNYLLVERPVADLVQGYDSVLCSSEYCVMRRDEPCEALPEFDLNATLVREGR